MPGSRRRRSPPLRAARTRRLSCCYPTWNRLEKLDFSGWQSAALARRAGCRTQKMLIGDSAMALWNPFPYPGAYAFDASSLSANWSRLQLGDCEPLPGNAAVPQAWVLLHNGRFHESAKAGLDAGAHGVTVANKATCTYANYLEHREKIRLDLFLEVARRAEAQQQAEPKNANAWCWQAYALGHYSQGISVAKSLARVWAPRSRLRWSTPSGWRHAMPTHASRWPRFMRR